MSRRIWDNVLALYHATHGIEMPLDIWNMHLYAGDPCQQEDLHRQKFMTAIMAFRQFVDTTRGGRYQDYPLIMTEFNGACARHRSTGELLRLPAGLRSVPGEPGCVRCAG